MAANSRRRVSNLNYVAQFLGVCSSSTLAEKLANLLAISEPILCQKARILDADSFL